MSVHLLHIICERLIETTRLLITLKYDSRVDSHNVDSRAWRVRVYNIIIINNYKLEVIQYQVKTETLRPSVVLLIEYFNRINRKKVREKRDRGFLRQREKAETRFFERALFL